MIYCDVACFSNSNHNSFCAVRHSISLIFFPDSCTEMDKNRPRIFRGFFLNTCAILSNVFQITLFDNVFSKPILAERSQSYVKTDSEILNYEHMI